MKNERREAESDTAEGADRTAAGAAEEDRSVGENPTDGVGDVLTVEAVEVTSNEIANVAQYQFKRAKS
jgi:hypothetical protein